MAGSSYHLFSCTTPLCCDKIVQYSTLIFLRPKPIVLWQDCAVQYPKTLHSNPINWMDSDHLHAEWTHERNFALDKYCYDI